MMTTAPRLDTIEARTKTATDRTSSARFTSVNLDILLNPSPSPAGNVSDDSHRSGDSQTTPVTIPDALSTEEPKDSVEEARGKRGYKIHKSCDYCRHRKVKCVRNQGFKACEHCKICDVECIFSRKLPSVKRKMRSAQLAASIQERERVRRRENLVPQITTGMGPAGWTYTTVPSSSFLATAGSTEVSSGQQLTKLLATYPYEQGRVPPELQLPQTSDSSPDSALSPEVSTQGTLALDVEARNSARKSTKQSVEDVCSLLIRPFTPFFATTVPPADISSLARCCISLASCSSPDSVMPLASIGMLYDLVDQLMLQETAWNDFTLSAVFCVVVRCRLDPGKVSRALEAYHTLASKSSNPCEDNPHLAFGASCAYAWNAFFSGANDFRAPPVNVTEALNRTMVDIDDQMFACHFMLVSTLLSRFLTLTRQIEEACEGGSPSADDDEWRQQRRDLIKLESEMLLWPVKLPKLLTVVKDELIATPGAIILHVLHNTILISYYCMAIRRKPVYGRMLSIFPVPGLLQFLCGMAASSFKCRPEMIHKWPLVRDCIVLSARLILELHRLTDFDNCKVALAFFQDAESDPKLYEEIQELLGDINWAASDEDGAALYWIFRDVRSMSLQHLMS